MSENIVLGIDGGGTRTRASIVEDEKVRAFAENGSIKRLRVGVEAADANLRAILKDVFAQAGVKGVCAASVGVASSKMPGVAEWIGEVLREFGATKVEIVGDEVIALDGAFKGGPGILGTVLTTDSLYAEIICDGIHNAPEMVKLWWRAKGPERAILVTDAMSAAGMPDGQYKLGGFAVQVEKGRATADGVLAGSVLTLDRALANFVQFTGAAAEQGVRLMTSNPAAMTGFTQEVGSIKVGQPADLVAVNAEGHLLGSVVGGQPITVS